MISPSPSEPSMTAQLGNAATLILLAEVVRDPALQCRAALDTTTVDRYVEAVDKLPPVRVIRVPNVLKATGLDLLLVDGWHRFAAHEKAGRDTIHAFIEDGDRRTAILAAVQANSSHGLPRSQEDTRRAVRVLLMDAEWCKLSDRKLAVLADVSHTHVAGMRKRYGVKAGVLLEEADANRIDGKMSPEWEALYKGLNDWDRPKIEKVRSVRTPAELAHLVPDHWDTKANAAFDLRAEELTVNSWPWSQDMTQDEVEARFAQCDVVEELVAMAGSTSLTPEQRKKLYQVVNDAGKIEKTFYAGHFTGAFKGRPKLEARLAERITEMRAEEEAKPKSHWDISAGIGNTKEPHLQAIRITEADGDVLSSICNSWLRNLSPEGREALRPRVAAGDVKGLPKVKEIQTCVVPGCGGWVVPGQHDYQRRCTTCEWTPTGWTSETKKALARVAELLKHEGYGFVVDGVVIDRRVIDAIAGIRDNRSGTTKISGPVGIAVRKLVVQTPPKVMLVDPKQPEPEEEEPEEPEEDEEEGEDDDDGEDS